MRFQKTILASKLVRKKLIKKKRCNFWNQRDLIRRLMLITVISYLYKNIYKHELPGFDHKLRALLRVLHRNKPNYDFFFAIRTSSIMQ